MQGQLGPFPSRLAYALDAVPEGARVTNSVELELRGPGRLLGRVAVPRVRDAVAANLRKLKELLEREGQEGPPDVRPVQPGSREQAPAAPPL
jgi:hypothetical protein